MMLEYAYKEIIIELKKQLEVSRKKLANMYNVAPFYVFNDGVLLTLIRVLPVTENDLFKCAITGSKYYRYGNKILDTIREYIKKYNIDVLKWRKTVTQEYVKKILSDENKMKNKNKTLTVVNYIKNGVKARFYEDKKEYMVILSDINKVNGVDFCSLKYANTGKYLVNDKGEKRVWILDKLLTKSLKLISEEQEKLEVEYKRTESERNKKIKTYTDTLDKSVLFNGKKLTYNKEQLNAIVSEGNTLVTARAGSGKTRVIMGKILYLMEIEKLSSENIMAFCFNREIKNEINRRFDEECLIDEENKYFGYNFAKTFHSLAYNITKIENEEKILENKSAFLKTLINKINKEDPKIKKEIYNFFKDSTLYIDRRHFNNPREYYYYLKNSRYKTLNGEEVKSRSEKLIADFLFEHDIKYVYERPFFPNKIEKKWPIIIGKDEYKKFCQLVDEKSETKPDFYLSDYNYVWEHWAINGNETTQQIKEFELSVGDYTEYKRNKLWKQKFWNSKFLNKLSGGKYNDKFKKIKRLLETDECLFKNKSQEECENYLKNFLEMNGVVCNKLSEETIFNKVWNRAIDGFTLLIEQFINKLQQYYFDDLNLFIEKAKSIENYKARKLYELGYKIYKKYVAVLHSESKPTEFAKFREVTIDYNELMYKAILMVNEGKYDDTIKKLKWILIDEYQDFSKLFDTLLKSIIKRNPNIKVFAVGDDWQAINRFAGSNIQFFHGFQYEYNNCELYALKNNYRSDEKIVSISNAFMKKTNHSGVESIHVSKEVGVCNFLDINNEYINYEKYPVYKCIDLSDENDSIRYNRAKYLKICFDIISNNKDSSIMILNRKNIILGKEKKNFNIMLKKAVLKFNSDYDYDSKVNISTVHSMKGEEADIVILLDANEGSFPVYNPNNDLFEIFNQNAIDSMHDEEKLFYVALTRAKHKLFVTYDSRIKSTFVKIIE